jgi:hypothetical protein
VAEVTHFDDLVTPSFPGRRPAADDCAQILAPFADAEIGAGAASIDQHVRVEVAQRTARVSGMEGVIHATHSYTTGGPASGVYGQDNNANSYGVAGHSNNGTAVVGDSSNGWAIQALGNGTQSRVGGGFAKAMAIVDPLGHPSDPVQQCFNSQRPPGQATSGNCGITPTNPTEGIWDLDFGFRVDDRFVAATPIQSARDQLAAAPNGAPSSEISVRTFSDSENHLTNHAFYIVVF